MRIEPRPMVLARRMAWATAWLLSMAGMMPSIRDRAKKASMASSSLTVS